LVRGGGGDMLNISDPTYLPISEEIKGLEGAPGDETPQGLPSARNSHVTLTRVGHSSDGQ